MNFFIQAISAMAGMLMAIIFYLKVIVALLSAFMILKLYDRFNIREKLAKVKGGLYRRLNNLDVKVMNFFDNR